MGERQSELKDALGKVEELVSEGRKVLPTLGGGQLCLQWGKWKKWKSQMPVRNWRRVMRSRTRTHVDLQSG